MEMEPRNSDSIILSSITKRILENGNIETREEINTIGDIDLSDFLDTFIEKLKNDPMTDIYFKSVMIKIEQVI